MLTAEFIQRAGGDQLLFGNYPIGTFSICTDTREFHGNDQIFLALQGESFNGFDFAEELIKKGCPLIIYTRSLANQEKRKGHQKSFPHQAFLEVDDSLLFYQNLAAIYAKHWSEQGNAPVVRRIIGITGSNGKTTTKDMLYHFLQTAYPGKVHKTEKNFNNHIGVPRTLLELNADHYFAVIEMGTNHPGEIELLCRLSQPTAGILTCIGQSHLEFFENEENVFKEKKVLYDCVKSSQHAKPYMVIDGRDPYLNKLVGLPDVISLRDGAAHDGQMGNYVEIGEFKSHQLSLTWNGWEFTLKNEKLTGLHNFTNMAMALVLAASIAADKKQEMVKAAPLFSPAKNRSSWVCWKNCEIFLDAYNANPSSMRAALTGFIQEIQSPFHHALFILGDMNELGMNAEKYHREIGEYMNSLHIDRCVFLGRFASSYAATFQGQAYCYESVENFFLSDWKSLFKESQYVFIKASRSLRLERIVDELNKDIH